MISTYTANSETKPSTQTPTGSGMFQRTASKRKSLKQLKLGLYFFFSTASFVATFMYVDSLKKKYRVYTVVFIVSRKM